MKFYHEASGTYTIPQALQNYEPGPQNEIGLKINKNKKNTLWLLIFLLLSELFGHTGDMLHINESCYSHLNTISGGRNFESLRRHDRVHSGYRPGQRREIQKLGQNGSFSPSGVSRSFLQQEACLERAKPALFYFFPQQKSADPESGFPVPPN